MSNVQVAVRARPLSKRELDLGTKMVVAMQGKSTVIFKTVEGLTVGETRDDSKEFVYDHSFLSVDPMDDNFVSQEQVYTDLGKSVLESAFQGYNACVFAYGQTGSGKTHTMMGSEEDPGLIPRICESLYAHIANGNKRNVSYRVEASYMEIYNEKVRDLLAVSSTPSKAPHNLKIREHPKEGPYVEHLSRQTVGDLNAILQLMRVGNGHRVTASTKMNEMSSRSHAMFTLVFTQAAYSSDLPCETISKIHLVDLAGSERVSATGAEGVRLKEGGNINRSLACLGNVISALADMSIQGLKSKGGERVGRKVFVPYRDSVLTWLLKDSLGGNSKTIMVATISPADINYGETLSTLRYASRAKNIVNKPVVNEDANVRLIRDLKSEIRRLKAIITAAKLDDTGLLLEETDLELNIHKKEEMIAELTKSWAGKWDEGMQKMVEERNLALHSEGIKMTLASEMPHLLEIDNDVYGGGIIIYHLKNGRTTIGGKDISPEPDIALNGSDIEPQHCAIDCFEDEVKLVLDLGKCFVNHVETFEDVDLSHGDLLQLGETTVFRFNHPEEARRLRQMACAQRNSLLPLSPIASSSQFTDMCLDRSHVEDELEEQREALERDYNQKMEQLREELELRNREDKAKLTQELDDLRHRVVFFPDDHDDCHQTSVGSGEFRHNSAYELMQSIVCNTVANKLGPDISDRVVVGQERDLMCSPHRIQSSTSESSISSSSHRSSVSSISSSTSPENRFRQVFLSQNKPEINITKANGEMDCGNRGFTVLSMDGESMKETRLSESNNTLSPPPIAFEPTVSSDMEKGESINLQPGITTGRLYEMEGRYDEMARLKREVESKLTETERSLRNHLSDQQIEHISAQRELMNKVDDLKLELYKKDLDSQHRSRANAMEVKKMPRNRRHRPRSHSVNRSGPSSASFVVEVPGFILRGEGWGSYHVFEVKIQLFREKWSLYKSYPHFKLFHDEITKRYSQLTVLSLPPSKWIGVKSKIFVEKRRLDLQTYMQSLIAICMNLSTCPLYNMNSHYLSRDKLIAFSSFFDSGVRTGL